MYQVCPWGQRAALALAETGAPRTSHRRCAINTLGKLTSLSSTPSDTLIEIDLQNKPSWYASTVNPASKVPVLRLGKHDDSAAPTVPESHVLLELVSDLHPGKLLPSDPWARAEARYFIQRFVDVSARPLQPRPASGKKPDARHIPTGRRSRASVGWTRRTD